jgi:hypothetical protein
MWCHDYKKASPVKTVAVYFNKAGKSNLLSGPHIYVSMGWAYWPVPNKNGETWVSF